MLALIPSMNKIITIKPQVQLACPNEAAHA